jgi:glutathione-regulated potassium-efflux system ancillary protein KefG
MKNVLVIYAHPNYQTSRLNKALIDEISDLKNVTVSNLYKKYPDGKIDILKEQDLITKNDIIVMQFPFHWYSSPSLMKAWIDEVFSYGFAYGNGGDKLKDKGFMCLTTTNASSKRYQNDIGFDFSDLLKPFQNTAKYCGMQYLEPFILSNETKDSTEMSHSDLQLKVQEYKKTLESL